MLVFQDLQNRVADFSVQIHHAEQLRQELAGEAFPVHLPLFRLPGEGAGGFLLRGGLLLAEQSIQRLQGAGDGVFVDQVHQFNQALHVFRIVSQGFGFFLKLFSGFGFPVFPDRFRDAPAAVPDFVHGAQVLLREAELRQDLHRHGPVFHHPDKHLENDLVDNQVKVLDLHQFPDVLPRRQPRELKQEAPDRIVVFPFTGDDGLLNLSVRPPGGILRGGRGQHPGGQGHGQQRGDESPHPFPHWKVFLQARSRGPR